MAQIFDKRRLATQTRRMTEETLKAPKTLLCLGCGYTAQAFAVQLIALGWRVQGTTRSTQKAAGLKKHGH